MAWKLRKDNTKSETPQEDTDSADAANQETEPATPATTATTGVPFPSFEDAPTHPALGQETDEHAASVEEPQFAPFDFSASAFAVPETPEDSALSPASSSPENPFVLAAEGPVFDDAAVPQEPHPHSAGPAAAQDEGAFTGFAPFQPQTQHSPLDLANPFVMPPPADTSGAGLPQEPVPGPAPADPPPSFEAEALPTGAAGMTADREELAPHLVMPGSDTGIPRVSPFIVDVEPSQAAPETSTITGTLILRMGRLSASFPITKDQTVIGRPDSAIQSYPDVEIELDDAVSRRHAEIRRHDGGYFLVDTMSTNGTRLNGEKLDAYKEHPLAHGDHIRIGDRTEIVFE